MASSEGGLNALYPTEVALLPTPCPLSSLYPPETPGQAPLTNNKAQSWEIPSLSIKPGESSFCSVTQGKNDHKQQLKSTECYYKGVFSCLK